VKSRTIIQKLQKNQGTLHRFLKVVVLYSFIGVAFAVSASSEETEGGLHAIESSQSQVSFPTDVSSLVGKKVEQIQVQGLKRIEKDAVLAKLRIEVGSVLSRERVSADIRILFAMGYFNEIQVTGEVLPSGGVRLVYRLKERPVIAQVEFEGNEKFTTSELKEIVKVKDWSILDVNQVKEDVALIQKRYEEKGYYLAKVTYEITSTGPDEVNLTYKMNDFDKVQIKKITFLNNKKFSDEVLKAQLGETREGGPLASITGAGSFKDSAFKQDLQRLLYWYLEHGYIKFRYETPVVTVSDDKKWLYISIYVDEGDQYRVGTADFSGDLLFHSDELLPSLVQKPGEPFSISKRNQEIQNLTEKYQDLGYAFVNVIPKMNVHEETKLIDFDYNFEKGSLVHFGEINILGNSKTYDKVIRRELKVREGDLYSGAALRLSREGVERLGFFSPGEVVFNTKPLKGNSDVIDLEITIKERSTGTVTVGAGWGSANGFFLTTQISEINLFGRGQSLNLAGQYAPGSPQQSLNLGFNDPYAFDTLWSAGFDVYYLKVPIPNAYTLQKKGFDLRLGHPIMDYTYGYLTYKFERLDDLPITSVGLPLSGAEFNQINQADSGFLSSVTLSAIRDLRNNRFETTAGNYQSASLEFAGWPGEMTYYKWDVNHRFYKKILGDLVFRQNTDIGQIVQYGSRQLPPAQKFYLGGPNDMRGFPFFGLGPQVVTGDPAYPLRPIGGTFKALAMFELEYPLLKDAGIKTVIFCDVGNAWGQFPTGILGDLRSDVGFGIRWFSPIGPLRLEWGYPLNRRPNENPSQFNFFIGPAF
jgi:outer membrane protein insertion porin family